jgi:hypothetical protein
MLLLFAKEGMHPWQFSNSINDNQRTIVDYCQTYGQCQQRQHTNYKSVLINKIEVQLQDTAKFENTLTLKDIALGAVPLTE